MKKVYCMDCDYLGGQERCTAPDNLLYTQEPENWYSPATKMFKGYKILASKKNKHNDCEWYSSSRSYGNGYEPSL